jgi:hypothetical protein
MNTDTKQTTFEKMVESGVAQIWATLGKGEDLQGAVSLIVMASAQWGAENARRADAKMDLK